MTIQLNENIYITPSEYIKTGGFNNLPEQIQNTFLHWMYSMSWRESTPEKLAIETIEQMNLRGFDLLQPNMENPIFMPFFGIEPIEQDYKRYKITFGENREPFGFYTIENGDSETLPAQIECDYFIPNEIHKKIDQIRKQYEEEKDNQS